MHFWGRTCIHKEHLQFTRVYIYVQTYLHMRRHVLKYKCVDMHAFTWGFYYYILLILDDLGGPLFRNTSHFYVFRTFCLAHLATNCLKNHLGELSSGPGPIGVVRRPLVAAPPTCQPREVQLWSRDWGWLWSTRKEFLPAALSTILSRTHWITMLCCHKSSTSINCKQWSDDHLLLWHATQSACSNAALALADHILYHLS